MGKQGTTAALLLMVLAGLCPPVLAEPPAGPLFQELGHNVDYYSAASAGRFATADLDHDGVEDLVFDGVATNSILFVVGKQDSGALGFKQALVTPDTVDGYYYRAGYARVLAWYRAPGTQIVSVSKHGTARIYAGWPLAEQSHFSVPEGAVSAAIGDVDADGSDDLLVLTEDSLHAYALDNGAAEWNMSVSDGSDIALAQLDSDPALEMIIAGPAPGLVLDGATRDTDWSYIDGFGTRLAVGVFSPGGSTQWVGAASWYDFRVFRANPWSPLWDYATDHDIDAVATGDLDGDGTDAIVYGDGQWGEVHVVDPITHQERLTIPNPEYAVTAIAVTDLTGSGTPEIAFFAKAGGSGAGTITVSDSLTAQALWTYRPNPMPHEATAIGDVDGDGRNEVVTGNEAGISIIDLASGEIKWKSPPAHTSDDPFSMIIGRIVLVPHSHTPGMDIVVVGEDSYNAKLLVMDGPSKTIRRQIGQSQPPLLPYRSITGLALMDFDGDGIDDYVVALRAQSSTGTLGSRLAVISGIADEILWQSVAMHSPYDRINNVLLIPPQSPGGATEMVAVLPGNLRAYNSQTQLLDWVLSASNEGAAYIDTGLAGPELMTYQADGTVTFHDAATQAYLRSFALPSPLAGMTVLQGDTRTLLAAANQRLQFVDGRDGSILATSKQLGTFFDSPVYPASWSIPGAVPVGDSSWYAALTTKPALWRLRLDASDRIFESGFETP